MAKKCSERMTAFLSVDWPIMQSLFGLIEATCGLVCVSLSLSLSVCLSVCLSAAHGHHGDFAANSDSLYILLRYPHKLASHPLRNEDRSDAWF